MQKNLENDSLHLLQKVNSIEQLLFVNDDIIDNDSKRRGKDTIHYATYNKYKKYSDVV